jgi:hypothetical protein
MQKFSAKHDGAVRQFIILSEAWYAEASQTAHQRLTGEDEITLGFYVPDDGSTGEFSIKWERLEGRLVPQLHAYHDAWSALANFADVLQKLEELDGTSPSVAAVATVLKECGVVDATNRVSPWESEASAPENLESKAQVLAVYQEALEKLRKLGRATTGNGRWAQGVEFGEPVKAIAGLPEALYTETRNNAAAVQRLRTELREAVRGNPRQAEKYKQLLEPDGK